MIVNRSFRGKSRLIRAVERGFSLMGVAKGPVDVRVNDLWMRLDLALDSHEAMYYGTYEEAETRFMRRHLREDSVFVDIGASDGYYTAQASDILGSRGSIHCFEPVPEFFRSLKSNLERSRLAAPFFLNQMAVSETPGVATMLVAAGKSRLIGDGHTEGREGAELSSRPQLIGVEVISLDRYLEGRPTPRVDFVKIDVEGHELAVLRGMRRILESGQRPVILTEFGWARDSEVEMFRYMESFGYRASRFTSGHLVPFSSPASPASGLTTGSAANPAFNVAWVCR